MKYQYDLQETNFTVKNIDIQIVSRPKGYKVSFRDGRSKHGFIYTVCGRMRDSFHTGEIKNIYVNAGELIFIPKGSVYTGEYLEDGTTIKIVQFDLESGTLPEYLSTPTKIEIPNAGDLIEAFFTPTSSRFMNHPFYYLSRVYELLWKVDESRSKIPPKYKKLRAALSDLNEYWSKSETVAYYAKLCNMSEVNFRRLFREYTGMSPIDYRNDLRLKSARAMLASGEYNVTEAAEASGFSSPSFFIRLYKKKFGYTPKKE